MPRATPLQRFQRKYRIDAATTCWEWTGCRDGEPRTHHNPKGRYGRFALDGYHMIGAHRAAYLLLRGEIPPDKDVCHTCDNPGCVNPDHLFLGSKYDNMRDMVRKGRGWHQKPGAIPPMLGKGEGRVIPGKGCVTETICSVCGRAMYQRVTAMREGKAPVCSVECKGIHNGSRSRTGVEVPCCECGQPTRKIPHNLKKNKRAFCSRRCTSRYYSRNHHWRHATTDPSRRLTVARCPAAPH